MSDEKQPLSSLPTLERDFADIIMHRSNTDKQGIQSNIIAQRATYKVNDGSLLYIVKLTISFTIGIAKMGQSG